MLPNSRQYGNVTPTMQMIHNDQRILPISIPNNSNEAIQYQQQPIIYNNNKLSHNASPYPIMYNINNPQNNNQQPLQNQKFMQSIGQAISGNSTTTSTTLTDQDIKNKLKQNFKYNCFKTPKQKVTTTSNTIRTVTPIPISNNMTTKGVVGLLNIPNGNNNISSTSTSYQVFPNNNNNSIGTPMLPPTTPANYLHHPLGSTSSSLMNGNSNQINNGTATPVVYHHHPNQQQPVYATPIHQQHINPNNNGYFTNLSLVTPSTIGTPTAINMLTPGIQQISTPSTIATTPHPNFYTSTVLLNNNNLLNSTNNLKFNPPIMNNNSNSSTVQQQNVTTANTTATTTNNLTTDNQQVISATNNSSFNNNNSLNNNQTINQEVNNTKKQLNDVINNRIESEAAEVLRQFHEVFDNRQQHSSSLTTPIQVLKPTANTTNSSTSTGSKSQQQINNNSKLNVIVDNIIVENNDNNIANNSNIGEKLISPLDTEKIIKRKSELINGIEVSQIERKLTFDEIENVDVNNEINDEKTNDNEPLFTERKEIEKKEDEEEVCIIIDEEEVVEEIHNNNEEEDEMISKATQRNTSVLSGPIFPTQNRSPDRILSSIPIEEPSITHIYNWCFDFMYSKDNELRVHLYGNTTKNDSEKFYRTSRVTKRIDNRTCETEMSGSIYQLVGDINNETMKKRKHLWDILSEDFIRKFCYCKEDGPFPPNWEELMEQEFERLNKKIDGRRSGGSFTQSSSQLGDNVNQMDEEDLLVDNKRDNETLFQERKRPSLTNTSNHSIKNNSSLMKKKRQEEENNQIANNNDNMEDDEHKDPLFSPRVHSYAGNELGGLNAFEDDMGLGKEKKTSDNEKSEDNMSDDENKNNKKKKETPKKQRGRPPKKKIEEQEEEEEEENKKKNSKTKGNNNKNDKSTSSLTKRNVSTNSKSLVVETPKKRGRGRPPKNTGLKVSSKMKVSQSTMAKRKDSNSNNKKRKKNETESDEEEEEEENNEQPSSIHSVSASTRARRRSNEQKKKKKQEEEEEEEEEEEQTPVKSRKKRLEERDAKKKKSNAGRKKKGDDGYSSSSSSVGLGEELEKELIALRGTPKASKIYENVKDLEAEDSYYETHNEKEEQGNYRKENKQVDKNKAEKRDNTKQKDTKSGDEKRRKSRIRNQPRKSSKLPPDLSGFIKDDKKDTFDINKLQTKGLGSVQIANFSKLKKSQRKQTVSGTAHILYSILSNSSNSSLSSGSNTNNNIKP